MRPNYGFSDWLEKVDQKEQELKASPKKRSRFALRLEEWFKKVDKASNNQKDNKPDSTNHSDEDYNI